MANVNEIIKRGKFSVSGTSRTRVHTFHVTGLTSVPFPQGDPLFEAEEAVGLAYGQPHPRIPGLFCTGVEASPVDDSATTSAFVTATFTNAERHFLATTVDIKTCEYQTTWTFDRDGKPKLVNYTDASGKKLIDYGQTRVFRSEVQLVFTRVELANVAAGRKASDYAEHISKSSWQGKDKGAWRCVSADAASEDSGRRYKRTYIFRYRKRGWKSDPVIFVNRRNGAIPTDIKVDPAKDEGNGYKRFDEYEEADFAALQLPDVSNLI